MGWASGGKIGSSSGLLSQLFVEFKRTPEHISDNGAVQHNEISDFPGLFKRLNGSISRE